MKYLNDSLYLCHITEWTNQSFQSGEQYLEVSLPGTS